MEFCFSYFSVGSKQGQVRKQEENWRNQFKVNRITERIWWSLWDLKQAIEKQTVENLCVSFFAETYVSQLAFPKELLTPSICILFVEFINQWNGVTCLHGQAYQVIDDRFICWACFSNTFLIAILLLCVYWLDLHLHYASF